MDVTLCTHDVHADSWWGDIFTCELPEGHDGPHRVTLEWADDDG